jgi:hypothetical protein
MLENRCSSAISSLVTVAVRVALQHAAVPWPVVGSEELEHCGGVENHDHAIISAHPRAASPRYLAS